MPICPKDKLRTVVIFLILKDAARLLFVLNSR